MRFGAVWMWHWSHPSSQPFGAICVGTPFDWRDSHVIVGTLDGRLEFVPIFASGQKTEGERVIGCQDSAISCILLHPLTNMKHLDIVAGDVAGNLFVIANGQIVVRHLLNHAVTALATDQDVHVQTILATGDLGGNLTGLKPLLSRSKEYTVKLCPPHYHSSESSNLDESPIKPPPFPDDPTQDACSHGQPHCGELTQNALTRDPSISAIFSVVLPDVSGAPSHFQLVADHSAWLYLYNWNVCVAKLPCPDAVLAVCCGRFTPDCREDSLQVAISCKNDVIYVMENYQMSKLVAVDFPVTRLAAMEDADDPSSGRHLLLCAGHFNAIRAYRGDKLVASKEVEDWIHCLQVCRLEQDKRQTPQEYVIIGQLDNTIQILELIPDSPNEEVPDQT